MFPACFVELPPRCEGRRAAFYLAVEELLAEKFPADDYVFTWQLSKTVVFGRHQLAHAELNLDFCRTHGIDVIRRKSGGGTIFADEGNIMVSLVTGPGAVEPLFAEYAQTVSTGLRSLGAEVSVSGRNDIVLAGHGKICGNAFRHLPTRNIVHGTMLYDTDSALMSGALTPDADKLRAKGVASVRSRVGLLKEALPTMSVGDLRAALRPMLSNRCIRLSDSDVAAAERIEQTYYARDFLLGSRIESDARFSARIDGVGRLGVDFQLRGSLIDGVRLSGDFFETADDAEAVFAHAFCGRPFTPQSLAAAVGEHHPERSVRGLTAAALLQLLDAQPLTPPEA